nr:DUF4368 domain-containing protein [uncultured Oscillibacter sp.]
MAIFNILLEEGLIKSARTICERIFITARRDFAGIIVFISRNRNKAVAKNPQSAADAFNQRFLNNEIIGLEDWVETREEMDNSFDQFAALVEEYVDIPELTPTIVNEFIKKIIVYAPEKQGTKRIQKVRIIFNFLDELDTPEIGEPVITETTYGRGKTA